MAQQQSDSTSEVIEDTLKQKKPKIFDFKGVRTGVDIAGIGRSLINPHLTLYQGRIESDFGKYIAVFEMGTYSNSIDSLPKFNYNITGRFMRIGADANFIHKSEDRSVFTVGLRYGRSSHTDYLTYALETDFGLIENLEAQNLKQKSGWVEFVFGLQAELVSNIYMGFSARYKFGLHYKDQQFVPFEIPGYGRSETVADNNSAWGINYYITYYFRKG